MQQTFGQLIRRQREGRGWSGRELAQAVKIDHTYLSRIERDAASPPGLEHIFALATMLELNVRLLVDLAWKTKIQAKISFHERELLTLRKELERTEAEIAKITGSEVCA